MRLCTAARQTVGPRHAGCPEGILSAGGGGDAPTTAAGTALQEPLGYGKGTNVTQAG